MPNIALGVIDLEEDFVSKKGKLSICGGEEIVEPIKKLVGTAQKYDVPVVFSRDEHDEDDPEFRDWPPHCIKETPGAQLIITPLDGEIVIVKGSFQYSAFAPKLPKPLQRLKTQAEDRILAIYLNKEKIDTLILTGLATDFCVGETALDAVISGFNVYIVEDCVRAVALPGKDGKPDSETVMRKKLSDRKVKFISHEEAMKMIKGE